ncbi:MAG: exosortase/archaeosortase family protein [Myxococcota bacterium]
MDSRGLTRSQSLAAAGAAVALAVAVYLPILWFMVQHWRAVDDYSHGFLIVPLAIYFAYERRDKLKIAPIEGSWWGLAPLALSAISLTVGRLGVELMSMRAAFVLTIIGLVLLLLGRHVFRILAFPLLFLFLMVPLPQSLVNVIAFPLQLIAAQMAISALHLLGIPALLEGNIIHLAHTELFVAEACSGLRSLMALLTLGIVFAYFLERGIIRRAIIVLSTVPIAIGVNAFRVAVTGILAQAYGQAAATGFIHDFQGIITFLLAFVVLLAEAKAIDELARLRSRAGGSTP